MKAKIYTYPFASQIINDMSCPMLISPHYSVILYINTNKIHPSLGKVSDTHHRNSQEIVQAENIPILGTLLLPKMMLGHTERIPKDKIQVPSLQNSLDRFEVCICICIYD